MAVKLVVIYPPPKDVEAFETVYNRDHVPMAVAKLAGKTKIVATRVLGSPAGEHTTREPMIGSRKCYKGQMFFLASEVWLQTHSRHSVCKLCEE